MGVDNRDWYRDRWRKRTGYIERAGFRMSASERKMVALRQWLRRVAALAIIALVVFAFRHYR